MQQIDKKGLDTLALNPDTISGHIEGGQPKMDSSKLPDVNEQKRMSLTGQPSPGQFNKSMEFMMMKRLNFLRNSLDTHNPHETTIRMRDIAAKRRDERILELWRKDQMQPKVEQLISKVQWHKSRQDRHDWDDDMDESLVENDNQSIASIDGKAQIKEQLQ